MSAKTMTTEAQRAFFRSIAMTSRPIVYLAKSLEEFGSLGGVLAPQENPMVRSLRCVADEIDPETGVADVTIILDFTGRRGQTILGVPFRNPEGQWPFPDELGGTWHGFVAE